MTSLTPQQIRELADRAQDWSNRAGTKHKPGQTLAEFAAALRTAADQLEAVQGWADHADPVYADLSELYAILTADTAPQEDGDE